MNSHVRLAAFPKITRTRYQKFLARFFNLEKIWQAELGELVSAGWETEIAHEFIVWREKNSPEKLLTAWEKLGVKTVGLDETSYPTRLAQIPDPPLALFYRGSLHSPEPGIGVVGTRRTTPYGRQVAAILAHDLSHAGVAVVSGLAFGIDAISHEAALEAGGYTIAVLGTGVDHHTVYPAANRTLANKIIKAGGAIVSEYPPESQATQYSFPARNRIIAGLTLGTLVIEAPEISGALITARAALDYNREVFVVPHPITSPTGAGGNNLLKQGAIPATEAADILNVFNVEKITSAVTQAHLPLISEEEALVLSTLTRTPQHIDIIIKTSGLKSANISTLLMNLEIKGLAKNLGGMQYISLDNAN